MNATEPAKPLSLRICEAARVIADAEEEQRKCWSELMGAQTRFRDSGDEADGNAVSKAADTWVAALHRVEKLRSDFWASAAAEVGR
jgi:hypothetical protein